MVDESQFNSRSVKGAVKAEDSEGNLRLTRRLPRLSPEFLVLLVNRLASFVSHKVNCLADRTARGSVSEPQP